MGKKNISSVKSSQITIWKILFSYLCDPKVICEMSHDVYKNIMFWFIGVTVCPFLWLSQEQRHVLLRSA